MISRLVIAAVYGAVAFLACVFVGGLLAVTNIPPATFIGEFLRAYAVAIAVLVALLAFFRGVTFPGLP